MVSGVVAALLFLPWTLGVSVFRNLQDAGEANDFHGDISRSFLTHSNLGGEGPDFGSEVMHILGVAADDENTDLVIAADSAYKAHKALENGVSHDFGLINLECNTRASLANTQTASKSAQ